MTATRATPGAIPLSNSNHLPPNVSSTLVNPVTLPPGRDRLATKPSPTGSETTTNVIGIVRVSLRWCEQGSRRAAAQQALSRKFVFGRPRRQPIDIRMHVAASRPPELLEPFPECSDLGLRFRIALGERNQHTDASHALGLLCAGGERPRGSRTAEKRDELPSPHVPLDEQGLSLALCERAASVNQVQCPLWVKSGHVQRNSACPLSANSGHCVHSSNSSARASTDGGIVRPSAFAVLRLITSSYLVGACTGRSAGFSPLRMRST